MTISPPLSVRTRVFHRFLAPLFLGMACLFSQAALPGAPAGAEELPGGGGGENHGDLVSVSFSDGGLMEILYRGENLLGGVEGPFKGQPGLNQIWIRDGQGNTTIGGEAMKVLNRTVWADSRQINFFYSWGELSFRYRGGKNRMDVIVDWKNTTEDQTITAYILRLVELKLREDSPRFKVDNFAAGLLAHRIHAESASLAITNPYLDNPIMTEIGQRYYGGQGHPWEVHVNVNAGGGSHPVIDNRWWSRTPRIIGPGESEQLVFTLLFGEHGAALEVIADESIREFHKTHPLKLNWPDRRPIGRIFLCNPATGWDTNPRGWRPFRNAEHDVFTEQGKAVLREDLLRYARESVEELKRMNAQGVIIWDVEGQEFPHAISYIGHPQLLPKLAPEMDEIADEFFAVFRDAGLETGITIRPTEVYQESPDKWFWTHRYTKNPVDTMSEKIEYAKNRWGTRIFYLDSNVFGNDFGVKKEENSVPWVMPAGMLEELQARHPDVLVIPEWTTPQLFQYGAGYVHVNLGSSGIDPQARRLFPGAFGVIPHTHHMLEERYSAYLNGVKSGDVLFCGTVVGGGNNPYVKLIYEEAAMAGTPEETAIREASTDALLARLDDERPVVRKLALDELSGRDLPADSGVVERLREMALIPLGQPYSELRQFAVRNLRALGDPALSVLMEVGKTGGPDVKRIVVRELGSASPNNPMVVGMLVESIQGSDAEIRRLASASAGKLKLREAVPALVENVGHGDQKIRNPALWALRSISGREDLETQAQWKEWMATK